MDTLKSIWNYFGGKDTSVRQIGQKPPNTNYQQPRKENFLLVNMESDNVFEGLSEEIQKHEWWERHIKQKDREASDYLMGEFEGSGMLDSNLMSEQESKFQKLLDDTKKEIKSIEKN